MSKPTWLKAPSNISTAAQALWKANASGRFQAGHLSAETRGAYLRWCVCSAAAEEAASKLSTDGVVIRSPSGSTKANPAMQAMIQAQQEADKLRSIFWPAPNPWGM